MVRTIGIRWMLRCVAACFYISASLCLASSSFDSDPPAAAVSASTPVPGDALPDAPAAQAPVAPVTEKGLPLAILKDQIPIWTSPVRIKAHDLIWLLPLGAATGVTLATDTDAMRDLSHNPSFNKDSVNASNALLGGQIAMPIM